MSIFMILGGGRLTINSNSFCLSDHKLNACRTALSYKQGNVRDGRHGPVIWVAFKTFYHNSSFTSHSRRTFIYTNTNVIRCSKTHNYICFLFNHINYVLSDTSLQLAVIYVSRCVESAYCNISF